MFEMNFDPDDFPAAESEPVSYEPLEPGSYEVIINEAEQKMSANNKPGVVFKFEIVDGKNAGRRHSEWFTYPANNIMVSDFVKQLWADFCRAVGVKGTSTDEFIRRTVVMKIKSHKMNANGYPDYKISWLPANSPGFVDTPF